MNMSLFPNSRGVCEEWKNKHPHSQRTAGNTVSFSKGHFSVKARGDRNPMGKSYIVEKGNLPMDEAHRKGWVVGEDRGHGNKKKTGH